MKARIEAAKKVRVKCRVVMSVVANIIRSVGIKTVPRKKGMSFGRRPSVYVREGEE